MADFIEAVGKAPKWALVSGAAVLVGLLGYGMYYLAFAKGKEDENQVKDVVLNMPDAVEDNYDTSVFQEYSRKDTPSRSAVADYWDRLGDDEDEPSPSSLIPSSGDVYLDPSVYSELERKQIASGYKTKKQIDDEHALVQARKKEMEERMSTAGGSGYTAMKTRESYRKNEDSIYMARLEQAYSLAAKYSAPQGAPQEEAAPQEPKEEERRLDLESSTAAVLPTDSFADDGIISSLETGSSSGIVHYGSNVRVKPVKATFLKNERLVSGNRVIIRLMQDMPLSDGTVIPANTHITGTCSIGNRMKINVTMLHYAGRMFPVDISVYDNDGTEGIYCPLAEEASTFKKKAKKVADAAIQSAGTLAGTFVTGNPLIGSMAARGIQTATSSIGADGSVSVEVVAGYEFYVYENVKEKG